MTNCNQKLHYRLKCCFSYTKSLMYVKIECSPNPELGLKFILMSTPPAALFSMDQEKLHKFIVWAVSTAIHSISMGVLEIKDYNHHPELLFEEKLEESLLSKLLRWLTAAVVSGRLPRESNYSESKSLLPRLRPEMLQALFDEERAHPSNQARLYSEEFLAAAIFYVQQLVGTKCGVLSSIVTALCLLLFSDSFVAGLEVSLGQETFVHYVLEYVALLKLMQPGDGHFTMPGRIIPLNIVSLRRWMNTMLAKGFWQ